MDWVKILLDFAENPQTALTLIQAVGAIVSAVESIVKTIESLTQQPQMAGLMSAITTRLAPKA